MAGGTMADGFRFFSTLLSDGPGSLKVSVFEVERPRCAALFAVGRGGNPERHLPLLRRLAEHGCMVIAPHFDIMPSSVPSEEDLQSRARQLELAVKSLAPSDVPLVGVGHSIGATLLLVLAGAEAWTLSGKRVARPSKTSFARLALFAPATDFFRAPGALDSVHTPIVAWAGTKDPITPPRHAEFLREALAPRTPVEVRLVERAGHFTFMNDLPPQVEDPYPDRPAFLTRLADETSRFVIAPSSSTPST
jgi:pimeloyl-ACP methyl ester carboxylesterase